MKAKRLLALLLAATMSLGALAGCGSKESSGEQEQQESSKKEEADDKPEEDAEKEAVTFEIAVKKHALSKCDDFNEMEAFKMAEEATNVHIDWIYIEDGSTEKVNALLTADLPDAFLGVLSESQIASSMDSFMDISGLLETYAPHVVSDYKGMKENGLEQLTWPDGSIRSLMTSMETSYQNDPNGILVINKAWLDQLGMDVPTTTEELYEVLCAFRDNDMNGNGDPNDEIPLELCENNWAAHFWNMANPWGIAQVGSDDASHWYKIEDGKVNPTLDTDAYRSFLEYMHKLAEEGLVDKEGFTETNDQYYAKLKSGVVGMYSAWTPQSNMSAEEAENWVPVRVVQAQDDITPVKGGWAGKNMATKTGFAITSECENPERLLEWWDYLSSSTEIKYTMAYGPQGGYWDIDDDGSVYQVTPDGLTEDFTVENYKYTYGMVGCGTLTTDAESIVISKEQAYTTWVRTNMCDEVYDQLPTENMPVKFVDPAKTDERTFMQTELESYVNNFMSTSIIDGIDDAKWEAHLEQLKALQYYDWIQWYQDYLDGTL